MDSKCITTNISNSDIQSSLEMSDMNPLMLLKVLH